jgi:2-polyprenyl-3-methyl-5-hydroxy-6-metoxy-1,4-benzoquinol methylase
MDDFAIKTVGLPWLQLTRDAYIHERCAYLIDCVSRLGRTGLRVLDVGCGSATALFYIHSRAKHAVGKYVGIDMLSPERLRARYESIGIANEFHQVHLDDDWSYGEFDVVWCAEVIEHLLDDRKLLRKLRSQLDPRGILIITTPSKAFIEGMARLVPGCEAISTVQDGGHVRTGYDLDMLRALADDCGLVLESHAWLMPGTAPDVRWHLNPTPSAVGSLARNIRDIVTRRTADFVIDGDPSRYAHRYMTISALYSKS